LKGKENLSTFYGLGDSRRGRDVSEWSIHTGNEKDTLFPGVGKEVLIEGQPVMIGDGHDVKAGIACFCDKLFGRVPYSVKGIFGCVQVEVGFKGSLSFGF